MDNTELSPYADQLEIWRDVIGYEGYYQVSNLGRIKRVKPSPYTTVGRILKLYPTTDGYLYMTLYKDGISKQHRIHRLVAFAFLGEPPTPEHQVNHINSNRADNRLENLEWLTPSQNILHGFRYGKAKIPRGESNPHSKLTWNQVHEIKRLYSKGLGKKEIGGAFNVSRTTISHIVNGETWKE